MSSESQVAQQEKASMCTVSSAFGSSRTARGVSGIQVPSFLGVSSRSNTAGSAQTGSSAQSDDDEDENLATSFLQNREGVRNFVEATTCDPDLGGSFLGSLQRARDYVADIVQSPCGPAPVSPWLQLSPAQAADIDKYTTADQLPARVGASMSSRPPLRPASTHTADSQTSGSYSGHQETLPTAPTSIDASGSDSGTGSMNRVQTVHGSSATRATHAPSFTDNLGRCQSPQSYYSNPDQQTLVKDEAGPSLTPPEQVCVDEVSRRHKKLVHELFRYLRASCLHALFKDGPHWEPINLEAKVDNRQRKIHIWVYRPSQPNIPFHALTLSRVDRVSDPTELNMLFIAVGFLRAPLGIISSGGERSDEVWERSPAGEQTMRLNIP